MNNIETAIKRLARRQCANYAEGHRCLLEPNGQPICNFYRTDEQARPFVENGDMRCFYFERHVLPADPSIEARYFNREDTAAKCARCGHPFEKKSNRAKYCPPCREERRRESARDRMRRKYWRDRQNLTL